MDIPYRLDTIDAVKEAMKCDLLRLGKRYESMVALAEKMPLQIPHALARARPSVAKAFALPARTAPFDECVVREAPPSLEPVRHFDLVERAIPWVRDIAAHENLMDFLRGHSADVRRRCFADPPPARATEMLESALATRRFLRREIVCYAKSKRPRLLGEQEFKRFVVACALFHPRNEDVLRAIAGARTGGDRILYENAAAELLFVRLPASLEELTFVDPKAIRRKLFARIAKLSLRGHQRTNLHGQFPVNAHYKDLIPTLEKIDRIARRLNIASETKRSFHDYVLSLVGSIERVRGIYGALFAGRELDEMRRLHAPRSSRGAAVAGPAIVTTPKRTETLEFYPTKDYLDLVRGAVSADCLDDEMSEAQLRSPVFFNVRIFRSREWIGNIYMLDFTRPLGVLLVDRIQIARKRKADYVHFFEDLAEVLAELFAEVEYRELLAPIAISNHAMVQQKFNDYKEKLPKRKIMFHPSSHRHFESVRRRSFYVLHRKGGGE